MAEDWNSDAWKMKLKALCHHHTNLPMPKVGHSHIDAGVHVCEQGPAYSGNAYWHSSIVLMFFRDKKNLVSLFFFFLFSEIMLNADIKSIV